MSLELIRRYRVTRGLLRPARRRDEKRSTGTFKCTPPENGRKRRREVELISSNILRLTDFNVAVLYDLFSIAYADELRDEPGKIV